jgi:REP element-mobilizing transposase RayT
MTLRPDTRLGFQSQRLRQGRRSKPGSIYLVTTATLRRAPIFGSFWSGRCAALAVRDSSFAVESLCFVVMPDHLHWLIQLTPAQPDLSEIVRKMKARTTRRLRRAKLHGGLIWQDGFHDYRLRPSDEPRSVARYVVMNPVRGGLVRSIREYPHWDVSWL